MAPNLTDLEVIRYTERPPILDALPSQLSTLILWNCDVPLSSISLLPRTLISLDISCSTKLDHGLAKVDFPPNLTYLYLRHSTDWLELTEIDVNLPTFHSCDPGHLHYLQGAYRPKVRSCFPLHCLPRTLEHLTLMTPIPASQLIHLPLGLITFEADDVFEDADFNPMDTQHMTRMAELCKYGSSQGINTPASHISLPASIISLLPRTLTNITVEGTCIWKSGDWCRLPPHLTNLASTQDSHLVSAQQFFTAPLSRLKTLNLQLVDFTDVAVQQMPRSLTRLNYPAQIPIHYAISLVGMHYWPYNLRPDGFGSYDGKDPFGRLYKRRFEAFSSSSTELFPLLFPTEKLVPPTKAKANENSDLVVARLENA